MYSFVPVLLLGALLAAPESAKAPPSAEFKIWAVEVHNEGRKEPHFDKGLEEVREVVKDSKLDTYLNLKTATQKFKDSKSVLTPLTERYTLETSAPTLSDDGRYRLQLRVTMKQKERPKAPSALPGESLAPVPKPAGNAREIEALSSKLLLQPDEKVVVRGLKLEDGKEMILVISLSVPPEKPSAKPAAGR